MYDFTFSNGTMQDMYSIMMVTTSNKSRTMKVHNFSTIDQIATYNINQKILNSCGFPIQFFQKFAPFHILVCNETIKIIHNGIIYNALNFSQQYQPGVICDSSYFYWWNSSDGIDYYQYNYTFYVALSNKDVMNITIILTFTYNYTSLDFDVSFSNIRSTIFSSPESIHKMVFTQ